MPILAVDPEALSAAGSAVVATGDGLSAAMTVLTTGFGANTGLDVAGMVFGLAYQETAEALLRLATAAINACHCNGVAIQVGASNYSKAEAASKLGGGGDALSAPGEPVRIGPAGPPGTLGPGEPPPLLWALVQSLVGDVWPDGDVAALRAAASNWRSFGSAASGMQGELKASGTLIGTQQIPEGDQARQVLSQISSGIESLANGCTNLATVVDDFASQVFNAQNTIRDLLRHLASLANLWHDVVLVFDGDALDEVRAIANDIKAVLHNLGREARALEQGAHLLMERADGWIVELEKHTRRKITHFLGEQIGNPVATVFDTWVNANEGVAKAALGALQSTVDLDPRMFLIDPEGAAGAWKDMAKTGLLNSLVNPREAGDANLNSVKSLVHLEDWRRDRPGLGFGGLLFEGVMLSGGWEAATARGAGAAVRASDAGDAAGVMGRAGRLGDIARESAALRDIGTASSGLTKDLDGLKLGPPKREPVPGGCPVGVPPEGKPIEGPRAVEPGPLRARVPDSPTTLHETAVPARLATTSAPHGPAPVPADVGHRPSPVRTPQNGLPVDSPPAGRALHPAPVAAPSESVLQISSPIGGRPPDLPTPASGGLHGPGDSSPPRPLHEASLGEAHGDLPYASRRDPVHSHEAAGDGWHRLPDDPIDPNYGEPLPRHWDFTEDPVNPGKIDQRVARLFRDPEAPFGRDPAGHAYTEQEYAERFNKVGDRGERWGNFPGNDGALPGTRIAYTDPQKYLRDYSPLLDRIGSSDGKYLAVMEDGQAASWEQRALHVNSLHEAYRAYVFGDLPQGWKIEVSEVAPGVGQPGGSIQVRIFDDEGLARSIAELTTKGVLRKW